MFKQNLTLVTGLVLLTLHVYGQQDPATAWGEATTAKMAQFLPKPLAGLIAHEPWNASGTNEVEKTWGDAVQNWKYMHPRAEQAWWFDDADVAKKLAAAEKEQSELQQQEMNNAEARLPQIQALQKQQSDLIGQKKYEEAGAVGEKIAKLAEGDKAKADELDERIRTLQSRGRTVRIQIHGNESLADAMYRTRQPRQASGSIKGHTVYRATDKGLGTPGAPDVSLAVYLGPEGFSNPPVKVPSEAAGPKCITVMVWLHTRSDTLQADEAVARKMLESIDYDGLAKLIVP